MRTGCYLVLSALTLLALAGCTSSDAPSGEDSMVEATKGKLRNEPMTPKGGARKVDASAPAPAGG